MLNIFNSYGINRNTYFECERMKKNVLSAYITPDVDVDENERKPFVLHFYANKNINRFSATILAPEVHCVKCVVES